MSKIQCIVSDIDGTLLPGGQYALEKELLHTAAQAVSQGLLMVAASGRPYMSLKELWQPIWQQMVFICANGTLMMQGDTVLYQNSLERDLAIAIAEDIEAKEGCEFLITCARNCYIRPKSEAYRRRIEDRMRYPVRCIHSLNEIQEDFLQISAFREDGIEKSSDHLANRWEQQVQAVVSGKLWMDFTASGANKGSALQELMRQKQICREHIAALGDSYNDISMFREAGLSVAMEWSPEAVKQKADRITADPIQEIIRLVQESY